MFRLSSPGRQSPSPCRLSQWYPLHPHPTSRPAVPSTRMVPPFIRRDFPGRPPQLVRRSSADPDETPGHLAAQPVGSIPETSMAPPSCTPRDACRRCDDGDAARVMPRPIHLTFLASPWMSAHRWASPSTAKKCPRHPSFPDRPERTDRVIGERRHRVWREDLCFEWTLGFL